MRIVGFSELAKLVAQISNLLYRRIAFGRPFDYPAVLGLSGALRIGNPRYSRLEICATGSAEGPPRRIQDAQQHALRFFAFLCC